MKNFAKVFEFSDHDVLVYKDYKPESNDEALFVVVVKVEVEPGVYVQAQHHYKTERARDLQFDRLDREAAESTLGLIKGSYWCAADNEMISDQPVSKVIQRDGKAVDEPYLSGRTAEM